MRLRGEDHADTVRRQPHWRTPCERFRIEAFSRKAFVLDTDSRNIRHAVDRLVLDTVLCE